MQSIYKYINVYNFRFYFLFYNFISIILFIGINKSNQTKINNSSDKQILVIFLEFISGESLKKIIWL